MFDAETAALIRSAPQLRGLDPQLLPQELTSIYAELAGLRLRAAQLAAAPDYLAQIERLSRIAAVYEAQVDDTIDGDARRAAAFVAGTAYQIVGRVMPTMPDRATYLSAAAIHPRVAAPLLNAEQSPDAWEAARGLAGGRLEDVHRGALYYSKASRIWRKRGSRRSSNGRNAWRACSLRPMTTSPNRRHKASMVSAGLVSSNWSPGFLPKFHRES